MTDLFFQRLNSLRGLLPRNVLTPKIISEGFEVFANDPSLLTHPFGLAYDPVRQLLYCSSYNLYGPNVDPTIMKIDSLGNIIDTLAGLSGPAGLAYDSVSRILYCADIEDGTIVKIDSSGTIQSPPFVSGLTGPAGLAYDSVSRILYCSNVGNGTIVKIDSSGTIQSPPFVSGLIFPLGLAYDSVSQTLYCSQPFNGIIQIDSTGTFTVFTDQISIPIGLLINNGYLYIASNDSNTIYRTIKPSCYNEGTLILALNENLQEEYIPIENLRTGDLIKTYKHGYRKIELIGKKTMINNPSKWNKCMYKMAKTDSNGLVEDLIITGDHSILVDELSETEKEKQSTVWNKTYKIDDKFLLLAFASEKFTKLEDTNTYTYYHLSLENEENEDSRYGIWANGILSETTFKSHFIKHKYNLLD